MTHFYRYGRAVAAVGALSATVLLPLAGCSTDKLLRATDPDLISPSNVNSPGAAQALRVGALGRLANATGVLADNTWLYGGLLADEFSSSSTFIENDEADRRDVLTNNASIVIQFRNLNRVRTGADQALAALQQYDPTSTSSIAEMYLARGYAEMQIAETFCNGTPLSDATTDPPTLGEELTNVQVLQRAIASFDAALVAEPVDAVAEASDTITWAAQVGRGRALRQLARYTDAVAAVAGVPRNFKYQLTFASTTGDNVLWSQINSNGRFTVGDSVEGNARNILVQNAIPFYSAADPRVSARYTITDKKNSAGVVIGKDTAKGQDGNTFWRSLRNVYPLRSTPIQLMNGIDAELIRAEAALNVPDPVTWLNILNSLRADATIYPPGTPAGTTLPALADPGNQADRVSLHFREKAFWTYGRGQRLGDLRHLARDYGRAVNEVFPVGVYYKGGNYSSDANFPVPQAEENNPNFQTCLDRNP
jgi:hypothetical protein